MSCILETLVKAQVGAGQFIDFMLQSQHPALDFNGLDANTCLSAVEALVRAGKAQIFESDAETVDETGFKLL